MSLVSKRYDNALNWIHGLGRFGIKPGLSRMQAVLELLDNPHHRISFVHVGGTNGKGSTAVMLASMLRAAGYSVGLYTSPYLLSFTNRMAVDQTDIGQEELVRLVEQIKPLVERVSSDPVLGEMTEFEVVTAIALTYFAEKKVDLVVLEVGLGGRLDATNVIDPLLSIITNISLEHTEILGDTIEEIAAEKAGIIKAGKPLLTAAQDQKALTVFQNRCREVDATMHRIYPAQTDINNRVDDKPHTALKGRTEEGQNFSYNGMNYFYADLFIPLRGEFQLVNAATALMALEILSPLGFSVAEDAIRQGLEQVQWPGRLELLARSPKLIMDGAHNPAAMQELVNSFPRYFTYNQLILVLGMMADKDIHSMLRLILPLADQVIFTRPLIARAAKPANLLRMAKEELSLAVPSYQIDDHNAALKKALSLAGPQDAVLVTGSLYTVSDVRAAWEKINGN